MALAPKTGTKMEPWQVETSTTTRGLPLLFNFEPQPNVFVQELVLANPLGKGGDAAQQIKRAIITQHPTNQIFTREAKRCAVATSTFFKNRHTHTHTQTTTPQAIMIYVLCIVARSLPLHTSLNTNIHTYIYIYIYMYSCVSFCVCYLFLVCLLACVFFPTRQEGVVRFYVGIRVCDASTPRPHPVSRQSSSPVDPAEYPARAAGQWIPPSIPPELLASGSRPVSRQSGSPVDPAEYSARAARQWIPPSIPPEQLASGSRRASRRVSR